MLVAQPVLDRAGRDRGQVRLLDAHAAQRRAQVLDVRPHGLRSDVPDAPRAQHRLLAGAAEGHPAGEILRELLGVAAEDQLARELPAGPGLESADPLADVVGEVGLAELAVVDAVEPGLDLQADDLGHGRGQAAGQRLAVVGLTGGLCGDQRLDVVRPR